MGRPTIGDIDAALSAAIASRIRDELSIRRLTRAGLAHDAKISLSTLEKALAGRRPFTRATVLRLESALSIHLRPDVGGAELTPPPVRNGVIADDEFGSYSRSAVTFIEGDYLTLRPSFNGGNAVYAYRTVIAWDDAASCLSFREAERKDADFTQAGVVTVPHQTGQVYLVTNRHGQYRLIVMSRPTITGEMHGILATLKVGRGSQLTPVASPIAFVPMRGAETPAFGQIAPGHAAYAGYRALLQRTTEEQFALLLGG